MKWKRILSVFMTVTLIAAMVGRYDLAAKAEGDYISITTDATPSDGNQVSQQIKESESDRDDEASAVADDHDRTDSVIYINSIAELTAVTEAISAQTASGESFSFPDDYVPSEEEMDAAWPGIATGSNALRQAVTKRLATTSDATASNALTIRPYSTTTLVFTQMMMDAFNAGNATLVIPGLPSGSTMIVKNEAAGEYISKGYEHFTMQGTNAGTCIFQDFNLWGGADPVSKGKGGIKATGGDIKLENVTFRYMKSKAVSGTGTLNISDCVFRDFADSSVIAESQVTIDNSLFSDCHLAASHGSAIQIGSNLTISNTTINDCGGGSTVVGGYTAGAIGGIGGNKTLTVSNCYFTENHGNIYGGAISLYQYGGTVRITDSYFADNSVSHSVAASGNKADGGAIGIFNNGQNATVMIDGCTFERNTAMDDAGALFAESNNGDPIVLNVEVKNCTFFDNEAQRYDNTGTGGAVQFSLNVKGSFSNNTFTGNICENPDSNAKGRGAAIGSHWGRVNASGYVYKGPTYSLENNVFVGNIGSPSSATNNRYTNIGGTLTMESASGNIGYDFTAASDADLSLQSVYGVSNISLAGNGSSVEAGCNLPAYEGGTYSSLVVPTCWIAPALTDDAGDIVNPAIHADNVLASNKYDYDQREMARVDDGKSDAGAVEIISAKFDANLGSWAAGGTYTYESPLLYVKKLAADNGFSYVYSAADPGAASVLVPADPVHTTDMFLGWTETKDGTDYVTDPGDFVPGKTYYAKWGLNVRVDLIYHMNDGSAATKTDPDGDYPENTGVLVKSIDDLIWSAPADSYFKAWTAVLAPLPADVRYQPGEAFTVTATNNNLYAEWQQHYRLSYEPGADSAEVTGMPPQPSAKIDKGQSINLAVEAPERPGWTFNGWKSDVAGDQTLYQPGQAFMMPGQNVVLTATWIQKSDLDLIYYLNDGSGVTKADPDGGYAAGSGIEVKSLADLSWKVPANHRFIGWSVRQNPAAGDTLYQDGDTYTLGSSDGHLYAQWLTFYTVTFETNGGSAVEPVRDIAGGSTIKRPYTGRGGYTLLGWYTDNGTFTKEWNFDTDTVTAEMTLYANWNRNTGGGGDGGGGDKPDPTRPAPTDPQPTQPGVTEPQPTEPETMVPETTRPSRPIPDLPDGQYVREENNILIVYSAEGVPLGYLAADDMSGTIYPFSTLPRTGDDQSASKRRLLCAMLIGAGGFLSAGSVLLKRKKEEEADL